MCIVGCECVLLDVILLCIVFAMIVIGTIVGHTT